MHGESPETVPQVRCNVVELHRGLSVWHPRERFEPPAGELVYECLAGDAVYRCQRVTVDGKAAWACQGFVVHGVTNWRVVTAPEGRPT